MHFDKDSPSPSHRMIVEVIDGKITADPHKIGPEGANQGGGAKAGFNKWW